MKVQSLPGGLCLFVFAAACVGQVGLAAKKVEIPLTEQGQQLMAQYSAMLDDVKADINKAVPVPDADQSTAFLAAHQAVAEVPARPNPQGLKNAPPRYAPSYDLYAAAQSNAALAAAAVFPDVEDFLVSDALDAPLAKCALLTDATPRGLAVFAQQGAAQEKLVAELLDDEALMIRIMKAGGAYEGKYGQAMECYRAIQQASPRAQEGVLQQLALMSSLEHPERIGWKGEMTAEQLGIAPEQLEESDAMEGRTPADVMTEMYLNYEKAYLEGLLDPAFDTYEDFEYRFIFPEYGIEHVTWFREMLRNYRPDHIVNPDYKWRYCRIVKTDVPYTSNVRRPVAPELGLTKFQDFFLKGGICGPRAFVGKLSTASFGIPTRGARQTGHAAMSHWTPEGWTTVFGAHWTFNRWRGRCGLDFFLETQARREPAAFEKVLRAQWVADALGEEKVNPMAYGVGGGFWNALAFYKKLAIVEEARIAELAPTGEELAESNAEAIEEEIDQIDLTEADKTIVIGEDGVISIPVAACTSPVNTDKLRFMKTIDDAGVQMHYNLGGKRPELLKYYIELPAAGAYELTARVVNVTLDGNFLLRLNRRTLIDVDVGYTKGMWGTSKPVTLQLKEGRNSLMFTIKPPNKGLTIKDFILKPVS